MLDLKFVRANPNVVTDALAKRGGKISLADFLSLEEERRSILVQVEEKKARRNSVSKEIGKMKQAGEDASSIMEEMRALGDEISAHDNRLKEVEAGLINTLLAIPNIPHESVPVGADEDANKEIRKWAEPAKFDFEPLNHWDIGTNLDILDFERAAKISGARFTVYKGLGARLERAVINFFLDTHTVNNDYTEIFPPFMVNSNSMQDGGTSDVIERVVAVEEAIGLILRARSRI